MGVETFNYIDSLNTANPTSTDNVSQGDDHLRGIKTTLKNSFPSVSGAVTATHTELNKLDGVTATTAELNYTDGVTSNIQTQLDAKQASTGDIDRNDNERIKLGTSDDLQIWHDGSNSYVSDNGTGELRIRGGSAIKMLSALGDETFAVFNDDGAVNLYYDNAERLATTTDGVDIKGTGALRLPNGTTAQQPASPSAGDLRWNTDDTSAEIYDGSAWGSVGGGGAAETPYAEHSNNITSAYSIASGNNAVSGGPITVGTGGSVTVPTGSTWTIV